MGLLDMLGYVGDTIGKPGRVVRGALDGRPEEMLAALPFSDSLGITDEANAVSGKDLLAQLGVDTGDSIGGDIAGMGVEALTDPLSYLGAGVAAKGLSGIGRGRRAFNEASDVFDLVPKGAPDAVDDAMRGQMIDRAFPVPTGRAEEAGEPAGGLLDELAGMVDESPYVPPPTPLGQVPPIDSSGFHIGYGYGSNQNGFANDLLLEGRPHDALRASFGGWDTALSDLERLSPEARSRLFGTGHLTDEYINQNNLLPGIEQSLDGRQWLGEIDNRYGDLQAIMGMGDRLPPDVAGLALDQSFRLRPFVKNTNGSPAVHALRDITEGLIRPSQIGDHLKYLEHLGVPEQELRRMAAQGQLRAGNNFLREEIDALLERGNLDVGDGAGFAIDNLRDVYGHNNLAHIIENMGDPTRMSGFRNIEPNIARQVLGDKIDPELAGQLQSLQGLLQQMRADEARLAAARPGLGQYLDDLYLSTRQRGGSNPLPDGLTVEDVAERFGLSPSDLWSIAQGRDAGGPQPMPFHLQGFLGDLPRRTGS